MCNSLVVALADNIVLEEDLAGIGLGEDRRPIAKKSVSPWNLYPIQFFGNEG